MKDQVHGCLLGGALGDALGAGIEFQSLADIRREHRPAGVTGPTQAYGVRAPLTDDTQMGGRRCGGHSCTVAPSTVVRPVMWSWPGW
nr:ADP-ribosylglycohydrolase family protein [Frankia gtarii]